MANQWTQEQRRAIETEGCNVLVSAAAGSGKTAVLVERIIRKITDPEQNIDIDRLVVVTFTKAAAAEMKQRIRDSVDRLLEEKQGADERLQRQLTLINHAQITTIDSFCLNIVRNYFTDIDIDPGFRTADDGEIKLIENDVMDEMLETYYASENQDFYDFVDAYGNGRDDSQIVGIITRLYSFARSYPWPEEWFNACLAIYEIDNTEQLEDNLAICYLKDYIKHCFEGYDRLYTRLEEICESPQGPQMYLAAIQSDHAAIRCILAAESFAEITRLLNLTSFDTLGRSRSKDLSEEKKEYVKDSRNGYKAFIGKLRKGGVFTKSPEQLLCDVKDNQQSVAMMVELAREFLQRMNKQKRERNIIDFNDMEHMALDILVKYENGNITYTDSSDVLSDYYAEILIDEYQDSNMLQEVILTAISKGKRDPELNNIYMVGDVKQSIYKFRLARPELFIEKYNAYDAHKGTAIKIELQTNFRSRANVLESTNDVFHHAMNPAFCKIEYDDKARLNTGFDYPPLQSEDPHMVEFGQDDTTKIVLIETKTGEDEEQSRVEKTDRELEAQTIAKLIQELHEPDENGRYHMVFDKNVSGGYRRIKYSDIVILTRSITGWADTFVNVLMNHGIPAYTDASSGYFQVREIQLILNYLTVVDNPLQDIPMAAVMLSFFGRFNTDELTKIRVSDSGETLYDAMNQMKISSEDQKLVKKMTDFLDQLEMFRKKAEIMSIYDLLWEILYSTGYYNYTGTMPAGKRRQANLDILLTRAAAFENTSYNGLFNFLRYIEKMQKFEVDFAEASILGEQEDLVRVMSIHKSKGLEFPVVILAGMSKKINQRDAIGEVCIDQEFGVGTNVVRLDKRTKTPTFIKTAVSRRLVNETISEELRVLYVAMTRAREKLIMTATVKEAEKLRMQWNAKGQELVENGQYSYLDEAGFVTYLDMVMPVACMPKENHVGRFEIEVERPTTHMENTESESESETESDKESEIGAEKRAQTAIAPYPYPIDAAKKAKITVSELKKMQMEADMDETAYYPESFTPYPKEEDAVIPNFISGQEKLVGNERGTAYHRVMECLDYSKTGSVEEIREAVTEMVEQEKLTKQQADSIDAEWIYGFCSSPIGQLVKEAFATGCLMREQPFVFIDQEQEDKEEPQLIQGVIDLYIDSAEGLILVDYKTDRVKPGAQGEEELIRRYSLQLHYYAKALEQVTQKKVIDQIIYSFSLGKQIKVPDFT